MIQIVELCATPPLLWALWRLSRIDLAEGRLPDAFTLPLVAAGLALAALADDGVPWAEILAAATGYGVPAVLGWAFWTLCGREGLGLGDAKLMAAAGAWLGPVPLIWVVLIASLAALAAIRSGRADAVDGIAFGPWLAAAFAAVHLGGMILSI